MESVATSLTLLAVVALGVSAGALIAEGAVLVPFWRSLAPADFLAWYGEHAGLLLRFFGPLEIAAAGLALCALGANSVFGTAGTGCLFAAVSLAIAVLVAFPLYFKAVNARFAAGTIEAEARAGRAAAVVSVALGADDARGRGVRLRRAGADGLRHRLTFVRSRGCLQRDRLPVPAPERPARRMRTVALRSRSRASLPPLHPAALGRPLDPASASPAVDPWGGPRLPANVIGADGGYESAFW